MQIRKNCFNTCIEMIVDKKNKLFLVLVAKYNYGDILSLGTKVKLFDTNPSFSFKLVGRGLKDHRSAEC